MYFPAFPLFKSTFQFGRRREEEREMGRSIRAVGAGLPSPVKPEEFHHEPQVPDMKLQDLIFTCCAFDESLLHLLSLCF